MLTERIGNVTLTQAVGSPFYYARYRHDGRQVARSLKTADIGKARIDAQAISDKLTPAAKAVRGDNSFRRFAEDVIAADERRVARGERNPRLALDQRRILRCHCEEPLGDLDVRRIKTVVLEEFVEELRDKDLSSATIKMILVLVSKTLQAAARAGTIDHVPLMPKVSLKQKVRGWFSLKEYQALLKECKRHEDAGTKVYGYQITGELRRFCTFSVNTFLRPSDAKQLRHRHVEIVRTKQTQYLRITTDFSKTVNTPVVSMPNAVEIYETLLKISKAAGFGNPDDFIFMPKYPNRDFVLRLIGRQLRVVLRSANLYKSTSGETRTLYSLRHSAIMFRLIKGKDMCLLTLARNARTSVEMIDRFYAKHLTAEMNVDVLQSMR